MIEYDLVSIKSFVHLTPILSMFQYTTISLSPQKYSTLACVSFLLLRTILQIWYDRCLVTKLQLNTIFYVSATAYFSDITVLKRIPITSYFLNVNLCKVVCKNLAVDKILAILRAWHKSSRRYRNSICFLDRPEIVSHILSTIWSFLYRSFFSLTTLERPWNYFEARNNCIYCFTQRNLCFLILHPVNPFSAIW